MRSKPAGSTSSSIAVTSSATCGRRRSTVRGVKALLTSLRRRVWSGGSINSIDGGSSMPARKSRTAAGSRRLDGVGAEGAVAEDPLAVGPAGEDELVPLGLDDWIGVSARIRW